MNGRWPHPGEGWGHRPFGGITRVRGWDREGRQRTATSSTRKVVGVEESSVALNSTTTLWPA